MSQVLYRKYRPEKWSEVIGQDHIVSVLKSSAEKNSIAHAYLFSGTRGTGKTTLARIFAKSLGITPNDIYEIDAVQKAIGEAEKDPDHKRRFDEIIERKRKEWNDREASRKLVD